MIRLDTMSRAVPTSGRRQRPTRAVMRNRMATPTAIAARIWRPGMTALTSVYPAPVMSVLFSVTVAYWSNQMLTPWSSR